MIFILLNIIIAAQEAKVSIRPLPRFAAIKAGKANSHVGPSKTSPIKWQYVRRFLPVEIVAEFDTWRKIKDSEGAQSWIHQSLLTGKRYVLITKAENLYDKINGKVAAKTKPQVIGQLVKCEKDFCFLKIGNHKGWVKRDSLWGLYKTD